MTVVNTGAHTYHMIMISGVKLDLKLCNRDELYFVNKYING